MQSYLTLLWALATLGASEQQELARAVSQHLARRLEAQLEGRSGDRPPIPAGADSSGSNGSSSKSSSSSGSELGAREQPVGTTSLSTALWACGKLQLEDKQLLQAAVALLQDRLDRMAPGKIVR